MLSIKPILKYDCEVLIAGGGPGGSALAFQLATKGIKVMVLESERFPRDKICGDGVSPIALNELNKLGIIATSAFPMASEIKKVGLFIEQKKVFIDLKKPDHLSFHARIIPRVELDNRIYEAAKQQGAVYLEDSRLVDYAVENERVIVFVKQGRYTRKLTAKMLVGADGSSSTVSRILNGGKPHEQYQLLGLRAYYENVNGPGDRVDIYFSGENFPGIYWMFPMANNCANIGLAMVAKTLPRNDAHVKALLTNHINNNKDIAERIGKGNLTGKISGWPLSFYNPQNKISANRIMLVGDAAGLINPLSGDGIQYALLSARWAASCITDCILQNDFSAAAMEQYTVKIRKELSYDFALSNLLIQFGRNKTFKSVWMEIMEVLIERAQVDKQYADIIAGIFEGTHPSYKALTVDFITKSLMQAGIHIGKGAAGGILKGPGHWNEKGKTLANITADILRTIKDDPGKQARWVGDIARDTIQVGGHVLKNMVTKKTTPP